MVVKQKALHDILSIRKPKNSIDRLSTLVYLECLGYTVPQFGLIKDLYKSNESQKKCVVWSYNGNQMMTIGQACKKYPHGYGAMYVGQEGAVTVTSKYVQIGSNGYWIDLHSYDNWMSNRGTWKASVASVVCEYHPVVNMPFFSMDFVRSDKVYAFDFDVEPMLRGYGLEEIIKPKDFKRLYREAQKYFERETCSN